MASRSLTSFTAPLHFVDEAPEVSTRTGLVVFTIVSGGETHAFAMTSHAAHRMIRMAHCEIAVLLEEQRNVVPFSKKGRPRSKPQKEQGPV